MPTSCRDKFKAIHFQRIEDEYVLLKPENSGWPEMSEAMP